MLITLTFCYSSVIGMTIVYKASLEGYLGREEEDFSREAGSAFFFSGQVRTLAHQPKISTSPLIASSQDWEFIGCFTTILC